MKTGHFEMVTILLAPVILMDIFQVMLGMGSMCHWNGNSCYNVACGICVG